MTSFAKPADPPIAAAGGVDRVPADVDDPLDALDDLMAAVEALCPTWPHRDPIVAGARMLL